MESPYDPASSVKVENGRIVELDGESRAEFDMIDRFIADYAINVPEAERAMQLDALEIARMLADIHVQSWKRSLPLRLPSPRRKRWR